MPNQKKAVAYFSMEIGFEPRIPNYAGGLGVLAGDTVKAAADLKVPMVAVTLVHNKGFFYQELAPDGTQIEHPAHWAKDDFLSPTGISVNVPVQGRNVKITSLEYRVRGQTGFEVPIIFLDTDLPENNEYDRSITDYLYGKDNDYRLMQEIVLGIGGVRMLAALGYDIDKYHMNEGHSAFIAIELYRQAKEQNPDFDAEAALLFVKPKLIFTTHTPVPAGHDKFPIAKVKQAIDFFPADHEDDITSEGNLNMTLLALHFSHYINGVAKRHGEISRGMYPGYPIDSITNGVHSATWTSSYMQELFDRYISGWKADSHSLRYAINIPDEELVVAHKKAKVEMIDFLNSRKNAGFDRDYFTIGFARRSTPYKRADLLLSDVNRLLRIHEKYGKIQIVFAGKAHAKDAAGKELIKRIYRLREPVKEKVRIIYMDNYDMILAKLLVAGVDLWVNTPRPPMEASGTSGMKAAHNGIPQLSTLDGWWLEGHIEGKTGWAVGDAKTAGDDVKDAESLYQQLEKIIPIFYNSPAEWAGVMKSCIALNASFFNTHRMVQQYMANAYFH
ncbi:MAG: alpha-glucan family phosphorylase [Nanoarchaeota archaeon]